MRTLRKHLRIGLVILLVSAVFALAHADYDWALAPNGHGRRTSIGPAGNEITLLELWGSYEEMGQAYGQLCGEDTKRFIGHLKQAVQKEFGVGLEQLLPTWEVMAPFVPEGYKVELEAFSKASGIPLATMKALHAIPDVSEYHCSFFAAWGSATTNGHLIQIRALDYATKAYLQENPAIICYFPDEKGTVPWVSVGLLGFLGSVTGMNAEHVAMSEIGDNFGPKHETLQGMPLEYLMRSTLETNKGLEAAIKHVADSPRTSSFLYCLGDAKIPSARALVTCKDFCKVYDWTNLPFTQTPLEDVVYMSMGTDSGWNQKVHDALAAQWGKIDPDFAMHGIMEGLGTGNLHAVCFDATDLKLWVANAGLDGTPGYKRTFVPFDYGQAIKDFLKWRAGGASGPAY